jgi:tripartite-type tricarboxylate transporter receptor subunit TctC
MLAAVALSAAAVESAHAQSYPAKPIRLIVPFAPGGGTDVLARIINQKLGEALSQQVLIDNRPGAGANIGAEIAAKSPADGYTLLVATISHAIGASLYRKLGYDLNRDFAPITLLAVTPHILTVHPSLPVRTPKEFIALAKSRPGQLSYASSGSGSFAHLGGALFGSMAGVSMNHIPYKGGGPAVIAMLSGECPAGFPTTPSVIQYVKSGKLRALGVTGAHRSPSTPELPTIAESGVPGYEGASWYGLVAPAGTAREIISRLHAESARTLQQNETKERLLAAGFDVLSSTPDEYAAFTRREVDKWAKVVKDTAARVE